MRSREGTVIACAAIFLVVIISSAANCSEAKSIGYGIIEDGSRQHSCRSKACLGDSVNRYQRGCQPEERCRSDGNHVGHEQEEIEKRRGLAPASLPLLDSHDHVTGKGNVGFSRKSLKLRPLPNAGAAKPAVV